MEPWKNSDATILVEDKVMHVHTNILSFASPVFEAMFNSDFKESKDLTLNSVSIIFFDDE